MMKKAFIKLISVFFAAIMIMSLASPAFAEETTTTGSENKDETPEYNAIDLLNTDLTPYISLGEYNNLAITCNVGVSDDDLYDMAVKNNVYTEVTTRNTKSGDTLNVSYVGKIATSDGKLIPVRGGTGSGKLTVGDEGEKKTILELLAGSVKLIGLAPNGTADINITMPADYEETAMAGKEVTFTVTVKSIIEYGYTVEYVSSKYGCNTLEEYKNLLIKESVKNFDQLVAYEVYLTIVKNSKILQYPEAQYNYYYNAAYTYNKKYYDSYYSSQYATFEAFLNANGISLGDIEESAKLSTEKDLICFAIYKTGVLGTISDVEYENRLAELASQNGTTVAEFETMYAGKHDISNVIIANYAYEKLVNLAVLTTDYGQYEYLLEEEEVTTGADTTAPSGAGETVIDPNVIIMIVIISVGVIGCVVLIVIQVNGKKKAEETDGEYDDDEDEEYEEDEEDEEEIEESDGELEDTEEDESAE